MTILDRIEAALARVAAARLGVRGIYLTDRDWDELCTVENGAAFGLADDRTFRGHRVRRARSGRSSKVYASPSGQGFTIPAAGARRVGRRARISAEAQARRTATLALVAARQKQWKRIDDALAEERGSAIEQQRPAPCFTPAIARPAPPLSFEEQLARVASGQARLVARFEPRREPDVTLAGIGSAML